MRLDPELERKVLASGPKVVAVNPAALPSGSPVPSQVGKLVTRPVPGRLCKGFPVKKSKYGNEKVRLPDGTVFDSKKEYERWLVLVRLQQVGWITFLRRQHPWRLHGPDAKTVLCSYVADFTYMQQGRLIVEDVKSEFTRQLPMYRLKKRWMLCEYGIAIKES